MDIRKAEPEDLDIVYELSLEALNGSTYHDLPHDEMHSRKVLGGIILSQFAWINADNTGLLLGKMSPIWFNPKVMIASDVLFYVRDGGKGAIDLLKAFINWGKINHADKISLGVSFGKEAERVDKLYTRYGFERIGGNYLYKG